MEGAHSLLKRRREWRKALLRTLYDQADGSVAQFLHAYETAAALGIDDAEARRIVAYHAEKGWLFVDSHRDGIVRITAAGVDEVEAGG